MLTPTQQNHSVAMHQKVHLLEILKDPFRFRPRRQPRTTRCVTPRIVPHHPPKVAMVPERAAAMRALLCFLVESNNSNFSPLTSDDLAIILDSGCTIAMTPDESDFIDGTFLPQEHYVGGIASGLKTLGVGKVLLTFKDTNDKDVTMELECLHCPDLPVRLLPPQQIGSHPTTNSFPNGAWIGGGTSAKVTYDGHVIEFPYDPTTHLPTKKMNLGCTRFCSFVSAFQKDVSADNLSASQRTLLRIHHRYDHTSMTDIRSWATLGLYNLPIDIARCDIPICPACAFGLARKRKKDSGSIGPDNPNPGDFVSVDTMVAGTPGLIPFTSGRTSDRRFASSTFWVDMASKYIHLNHQEKNDCEAALRSKTEFETFSESYDRKLKHIHSDNGIFASKSFVQNCAGQRQKHTFCGVGAHWQNGSVERYIGIISGKARTMLLHAMRMWPTMITPEFWTFALSHAKTIHNMTPRRGKTKCPYEEFTDELPPLRPPDFRTFGCPVFVLTKEMQDGKPTGNFSKAKSYLGVHIGQSPKHSGNVPIVYNPATGLVSPQYHVIFDESFSIASTLDPVETRAKLEKHFDALFESHEWIHADDFVPIDSDQGPDSSRYYFDASWDIDAISEDLHERRKTVRRILAKAVQKNSILRKKLGMPKRCEGDASPVVAPGNVATVSSPVQVDSASPAPTQAPQRNTSQNKDRVWINTRSRKRKLRSNRSYYAPTARDPSSISEGAPSSVSEGDPIPRSEGATEPSVLHHPIDPSPVSNHTGAQGDHTSTHRPPKDSVNPSDPMAFFANLATNNPGMDDSIASFAALFSAMQSDTHAIPFDDEGDELDFETICKILDERRIIHDCVSLDGQYGSFIDPFSFAAASKGSNPDSLTRSSMLRADDSEEFLKVEAGEITGLEDFDVFEYFPIGSIPNDRRRTLLNAIWSYRRKRRPDGSLLKYKSRICADGSQQKDGIDYFANDIYSPVVQWSTVRLTLILSTLLGLKSRQIDYIQAFPQAPLEEDVYMRIPEGWRVDPSTGRLAQVQGDPKFKDKSNCIKLKKNLYGICQASKNFYDYLSDGLIAEGFVPSLVDPCLWLRDDCMICQYVDDCILFANDGSTIDSFITSMRGRGYLLKDEGDIENFLGVNIKSNTSSGTKSFENHSNWLDQRYYYRPRPKLLRYEIRKT